MPRSFIDTNIALYCDDRSDPRKQSIAVDLIERLRVRREAVLSIQVLSEYYSAATRKLGVDPATARRKVELLGRFDVVIPSVSLILAATDMQRIHRLSFWDALIVQSAIVGRCEELVTEDLHPGQALSGVRVVNPFA